MERDWKYEGYLNEWLARGYFNVPTVHIRLNLLRARHYTDKEADARKTFAIFRNHINQHFKGNRARRFEPEAGLKMSAAFHWEQQRLKFLKKQQPHIHIICEIPSGKTAEDIDWFVREKFIKKHKYVSPDFYIDDTRNTLAAIHYNNRYGADTILAF